MAAFEFPNRILVLLDGSADSSAALARAARLVTPSQGEVFALRVVEPPRSHFFSAEAMQKQELLFAELQAGLEGELEEVVDPLRESDLRVTTQVLRGRPYQEAIREVLRRGLDLVLVGVPAGAESGTVDLDSEVLHLVRKCPCPVWIDRRGGEPVRRLLVAVDLEPPEESPPSLSAKLMRLALAIAELDGAALHLAHAWMLYREESTLRLAGEAASWLSHEAEARHAERLQSFLKEFDLGGRGLEIHLENGRPEEEIARLLASERVDLLVLGSVTRLGIPGLLIGSTAERLIHRAGCSVLAAKPDGFASAVTIDS